MLGPIEENTAISGAGLVWSTVSDGAIVAIGFLLGSESKLED